MPAAAAALPWISAAVGAYSAISTVRAQKKASAVQPTPIQQIETPAVEAAPEVVQPTVEADAVSAADKAAQEAQQKKLAQRRAARANSLLSEAGGMGDPTSPLVDQAKTAGKLTLGA